MIFLSYIIPQNYSNFTAAICFYKRLNGVATKTRGFKKPMSLILVYVHIKQTLYSDENRLYDDKNLHTVDLHY